MRFDVNISARKKGAEKLGTRTEVKNLNSFRSVERAASYEFERQVKLLEKGEKIKQETRGWLDDEQKTVSQRSKEEAQDYRYMPDPDIPPVVLIDEDIAGLQADFPKMPSEFRAEWAGLNLDSSVVNAILNEQILANLLDKVYTKAQNNKLTKRIFNWFASATAEEIGSIKITSGELKSDSLIELSQMVEENKLSSTGGKDIFVALFTSEFAGKSPIEIAESKNLLQVSDAGMIAAIVDEVLADPSAAKAIADIKAGNDKAIGFLVGQIMKKSQGRANPALAQKLIRERL